VLKTVTAPVAMVNELLYENESPVWCYCANWTPCWWI